jgi:glycosyltransferase involved in cell wall biosynthesis
MRILISCSDMGVGGAEQIVVQIVIGLVERGHEVGLAAHAGELDSALSDVPHERFFLPRPTRSLTGVARLLVAMRSAVRKFNPDVIHAQNVLHAALSGAAARTGTLHRPPVLGTFHGVTPTEYRLSSRLLRCADAVTFVSEDLLNLLVGAGYPAARAHLVRNAIDLARPLTAEQSKALDAELDLRGAGGSRRPVVAIVGRLVPQKDHERFFRAAAYVLKKLPETRFLVVGDGELRSQLQAQTRKLTIADSVVFTLYRNDARDIIATSDLLVFSSKWEGLSIAALEALACGTPVVSTAAAGMNSLLGTGAGVVVEGGPEALAGAIVALLLDDDRRAAMGSVGRQLVEEEFSRPAMLDSFIELYEALIRARRRGNRLRSLDTRRVSRLAAAMGRNARGKVAQ